MMEWIVTSSAMILIIIALRGLLKGKISLKLQYGLWALVLIRLLLPFSIVDSAISISNVLSAPVIREADDAVADYETAYQSAVQRHESSGTVYTDTEIRQQVQQELFDRTYEKIESQYTQTGEVVPQVQIQAEAQKQVEVISLTAVLTEALPYFWIAGMIVVAVALIGSNLHFWWKLRQSRKALDISGVPLKVYLTDYVATPCLFGFGRPDIYLTNEVMADSQMRRHVIAHELSHYRQGDHIWSMLRCVCLVLHWYNPLVWVAAILSKQDAELACDEATIKTLGEAERVAYGRTLIGMTCVRRDPGSLMLTATTMLGTKKTLKERIALIAKKPKTALYTLIACILVVSLAVGCTFTGAPAQTGEEKLLDRCREAVEYIQNLEYFEITEHYEIIEESDYIFGHSPVEARYVHSGDDWFHTRVTPDWTWQFLEKDGEQFRKDITNAVPEEDIPAIEWIHADLSENYYAKHAWIMDIHWDEESIRFLTYTGNGDGYEGGSMTPISVTYDAEGSIEWISVELEFGAEQTVNDIEQGALWILTFRFDLYSGDVTEVKREIVMEDREINTPDETVNVNFRSTSTLSIYPGTEEEMSAIIDGIYYNEIATVVPGLVGPIETVSTDDGAWEQVRNTVNAANSAESRHFSFYMLQEQPGDVDLSGYTPGYECWEYGDDFYLENTEPSQLYYDGTFYARRSDDSWLVDRYPDDDAYGHDVYLPSRNSYTVTWTQNDEYLDVVLQSNDDENDRHLYRISANGKLLWYAEAFQGSITDGDGTQTDATLYAVCVFHDTAPEDVREKVETAAAEILSTMVEGGIEPSTDPTEPPVRWIQGRDSFEDVVVHPYTPDELQDAVDVAMSILNGYKEKEYVLDFQVHWIAFDPVGTDNYLQMYEPKPTWKGDDHYPLWIRFVIEFTVNYDHALSPNQDRENHLGYIMLTRDTADGAWVLDQGMCSDSISGTLASTVVMPLAEVDSLGLTETPVLAAYRLVVDPEKTPYLEGQRMDIENVYILYVLDEETQTVRCEMYPMTASEPPTEPVTEPTTEPIGENPEIARFQELLSYENGYWYWRAMGCVFDKPENIDMSLLCYIGMKEEQLPSTFTDDEIAFLKTRFIGTSGDDSPWSNAHKLPRAELEAVMQTYFGLSLEDVDTPWIYYSETDAYYHVKYDGYGLHGYTVTDVVTNSDGLIYIYWTIPYGLWDTRHGDELVFLENPQMVMVLEENEDGGFLIRSNLPVLEMLPQNYTVNDVVAINHSVWNYPEPTISGNQNAASVDLPVIMPFSQDAIAVQSEIIEFTIDNDTFIVESYATLSDGILSVIIKERTYYDVDHYTIYNFDMTTGDLLAAPDMVSAVLDDVSYVRFLATSHQYSVEETWNIFNDREAHYRENNMLEYYQRTLNEMENDTIRMFDYELCYTGDGLCLHYVKNELAGARNYPTLLHLSGSGVDWNAWTEAEAYNWFFNLEITEDNSDGREAYSALLLRALFNDTDGFVSYLNECSDEKMDQISLLVDYAMEGVNYSLHGLLSELPDSDARTALLQYRNW